MLNGVDDVRLAYVVGVPDPDRGARVCAVVVANDGRRLDVAELAARCKSHLAAYKIPKQWIILPDADPLPYTSTNKIDKRALAAAIESGELQSAPVH